MTKSKFINVKENMDSLHILLSLIIQQISPDMYVALCILVWCIRLYSFLCFPQTKLKKHKKNSMGQKFQKKVN